MSSSSPVDDSGGEYWFGGGCYDITDAPVDDSCFSDAVDVPALMLAAINAVRTAAGQSELNNPIDVSARVEGGLERILVESLPPFPVDRISVEDYEAETFHLVLPNPLDYQMDAQGNVTGYAVTTQPEWDCWMSIDADAELDYTDGPQTLQWDLSYAMAVEQQACNDLIELFFDDASTPCGMETAMTLDRVGDLNPNEQCD